jgi:hypothetical protein
MVVVSDRAIRFFSFILNANYKDVMGLAFYPFIFVPSTVKVTPKLLNHERIHLRQQREMLVLPFHIWYLIALYRKGYMNISFEKEAYANEDNMEYLKTRKPFQFLKYYES